MRFLEQFVEAPLAKTLGWALLHSLWEGALIAIASGAMYGLQDAATRSGIS